jgi:hypothetical protein
VVPAVTFGTHCYEGDWRALLWTDRLRRMIAYNGCQFVERRLLINNVEDVAEVRKQADPLVTEGALTSVEVVAQYADEALRFFGIDKKSFRGGYYYSIQHLVSIYLCKTEYLLYFTADSILDAPATWIEPCITRMLKDPNLKVAIPLWNGLVPARAEAESEEENFFIGYGFSDQCYLVRTADYRAQIYNERHRASERYPAYGGELFEKRVDSWMRNHGYRRLTYKHASYTHRRLC